MLARQEKALWGRSAVCGRLISLVEPRGMSVHVRSRGAGAWRKGALFSELGVVMARLFCEAVRLSACHVLQMSGGKTLVIRASLKTTTAG